MIELEEVCLTVDECESIRLADLIGMSYEEAGCRMGVSRATFGRIVQQARKIIADALINGKAINIDGGNYRINEEERIFMCCKCNKKWEEPWGTGMPRRCPSCDHDKYLRVWEKKQ